jgi:hypothetical protein
MLTFRGLRFIVALAFPALAAACGGADATLAPADTSGVDVPEAPDAALGPSAPDASSGDGPDVGDRASPSVGSEPFSVSLAVGQRDVNGNFIGGTELVNLADYGGRLYAGNGYWEDVPGTDPPSGPQVLVLDAPKAAWRQDHVFSDTDASGQLVYGRLTALNALTFTTDARGAALHSPVTMLVVGLERRVAGANGAVFARADDGSWTQLAVNLPAGLSVRALTVHRDAATGADELFIGAGKGEDNTSAGAIFTAAYDPAAPGRLRVAASPEFTGFVNRVMTFADANGTLLFAAKPGLYARTEGPTPTWSQVASTPTRPDPNSVRDSRNSGVRGLTVLGGSAPAVLGGLEGTSGPILRFDANAGFSPTVDVNVGDVLLRSWGMGQRQYVISAYNDMPAIADPTTGTSVNVIGLQAYNPSRPSSAWYLVRSAQGDYALHEVSALTNLSPYGLVAIRATHVSPFAEDRGQAVYMGGCDADYRPSHNTAWLYRVGSKTVLAAP